eukprot:11217967-Lingulodinium_polyedra.AAC.1
MEPINARLAEVLGRGEELAGELRPAMVPAAPPHRAQGKQPQPAVAGPRPPPGGAPVAGVGVAWRALEAAGG